MPRLDLLPNFNKSSEDWHTVPQVSQAESFSSLFGVPIVGLPPADAPLAADFTMQTSYMLLSCAPWELLRPQDKRLANYTNYLDPSNPFWNGAKMLGNDRSQDVNVTFFIDLNFPRYTKMNASAAAHDTRPRFLFFGYMYCDAGGTKRTISATKCSITEAHVEVGVTCLKGRHCRAARMRRSLIDKRHQNIVSLDLRAGLVIKDLPALGDRFQRGSSLIEHFLRGQTAHQEPAVRSDRWI